MTDPSGKVVLYKDNYRAMVVSKGVFLPTQLAPFKDTPNAGGEYKVWLSKFKSFEPNCSKTDAFKIAEREESESDKPARTREPSKTPKPTKVREPSETPKPTETREASKTPKPTNAPKQSATPATKK